jgi:hypothetical protein
MGSRNREVMSSKLKLVTASVALLALVGVARAQEREYAEAPKLNLTLTAEKTAWRLGETAHVRIRIENATGGKIEIPSTIYFQADNRPSDDGRVTMSHGVFWSPVSLTQTYGGGAGVCRSDLTPERVEVLKKKVVVIHPAKDALVLEKGDAKEFSFDLARTCWGHSIAAFYPSETIFEATENYGRNTYRVYFEMEFRKQTSTRNDPRYHQLKSNAVEVTIN